MRKSRSAAGTTGAALTVRILSAWLTDDGHAAVLVELPGRDAEEHVFVTVRQRRTGLTTIAQGESVTRGCPQGIHTVLLTTQALDRGPGLRLGKAFIEARVYTWNAAAMGEYGADSRLIPLRH